MCIMRLSCPNCATEYEVPDAALIGRSRKLRCAQCGTQWQTEILSPDSVPEQTPPPAQESPSAPEPEGPAPYWTTLRNAPTEPPKPIEPPPRRFGVPLDEEAQAEILKAVSEEQAWPRRAAPASEPTPAPEPEPEPQAALPAEPEPNTEEGAPLPPANYEPLPQPPLPAPEQAAQDSFAELVHAARNKAIEFEPDEPETSRGLGLKGLMLFVVLPLLVLIIFALLGHHLVEHILPSTAGLFRALGLE